MIKIKTHDGEILTSHENISHPWHGKDINGEDAFTLHMKTGYIYRLSKEEYLRIHNLLISCDITVDFKKRRARKIGD